jgi:hypothetical protein
MKKTRIILGCVGLGLVVGVSVVILHAGRSELSMTFVEFRGKWPQYGVVRLINGSRRSIQYVAEPGGTPTGRPILRQRETSRGWTDESSGVGSGMFTDTAGTRTYIMVLPHPTLLKQFEIAQVLELGPRQSVEFLVRLEPGDLPIRIGTVCIVREGPISKRLRPYLDRLKVRFGVPPSPSLPGHREVWCAEPLQLPSSQGHFAED